MANGLSIRIADPAERDNLAAFVTRALHLDDAAVIRLHRRSAPGILTAWVATSFGVLAARTVRADLEVPDATVAADVLHAGLASSAQATLNTTAGPVAAGGGAGRDDAVALGYSMDSAWRGALPPEAGFNHIDDVPATMLLDLARRGADAAKEQAGPQGPPRSLLDQEVLAVTTGGASFARRPVGIPMRVVFALTAMGFVPDSPSAAELVRVRATSAWLRLDARYGSVAQHRGGGLGLTVTPRH